MQPQRLDHLVFAVDDLRAAIDAWSRAFDIDVGGPVQPRGTHMELAFLQPPAENGAFMELVRATTPDHRVAQHVEQHGEGMFSLSIQVADLDAAVAELRDAGLTVSDPEPGVLEGTRVARIPRAEAHGVAVQLLQRQ